MQKVSVLGAGMVGSAIARDLSKKFKVTVYDINNQNLEKISVFGIPTVQTDLSSAKSIKESIKDADFVVNAMPGFLGFNTLKNIIENKKNVVDIAFFPEDALELDKLAQKNNITAIVDIGVAPGISNFVLGYHYNKGEKINSFKCYVGGLPVVREEPFQYKAPFSPIDVIEEYTRDARYLEDGKIVTKPAMTDIEHLFFEGIGTLQAFNSDGLRSLLKTVNIPNMVEKTLRYPGHIEKISLLRDMGFLLNKTIKIKEQEINILDFTSKILIDKWKLLRDDKEFTVMKIIIEILKSNQTINYIYDLIDYTDSQNGISSMARTTGYTATAALNILSDGLFYEKGVIPPEKLAINDKIYNYMFNYLSERNVNYKFSIVKN